MRRPAPGNMTGRFVAPSAGRTVEIAVLTAANVVATLMRFIVLRTWIGSRASAGPGREVVSTEN